MQKRVMQRIQVGVMLQKPRISDLTWSQALKVGPLGTALLYCSVLTVFDLLQLSGESVQGIA